jgi:membrane protein DedA with SNARE-associated domain
MQGRSIPELFTDLVVQLATLLRKEGQLARAELSEKITTVATGLGLVVGGAVLLIPALVILLQAAVAALAEDGFARPYSALIVGGVALLIGLILAFVGIRRFKAETFVPYKTLHQLQRDVSVAKQQTRQDHGRQQAA